jgi:hypothetical protein
MPWLKLRRALLLPRLEMEVCLISLCMQHFSFCSADSSVGCMSCHAMFCLVMFCLVMCVQMFDMVDWSSLGCGAGSKFGYRLC